MLSTKEKAARVTARHITDALNDDPELANQLGQGKGIIPGGRSQARREQVGWSDKPKNHTSK